MSELQTNSTVPTPVPAPITVVSSAPVPANLPLPAQTIGELLEREAPQALKTIPREKGQLLAMRVERHEISVRGGPLPAPSDLAEYNQIIPNGADRIMKMAENQSAHRIEIEKVAVTSQQNQARFGQQAALLIAILGLGLATVAALQGQPTFGGVIGGTTLVSLVGAFLYRAHAQKAEMGAKRNQMKLIEQQLRHPQPQPQSKKKKKKR